MDVGVLGAKAILNALSEHGYAETAYKVAVPVSYTHLDVYKRQDFSIASVTVREVSKMEFYFCPSGAATFELPYVGNGVFTFFLSKDKQSHQQTLLK